MIISYIKNILFNLRVRCIKLLVGNKPTILNFKINKHNSILNIWGTYYNNYELISYNNEIKDGLLINTRNSKYSKTKEFKTISKNNAVVLSID